MLGQKNKLLILGVHLVCFEGTSTGTNPSVLHWKLTFGVVFSAAEIFRRNHLCESSFLIFVGSSSDNWMHHSSEVSPLYYGPQRFQDSADHSWSWCSDQIPRPGGECWYAVALARTAHVRGTQMIWNCEIHDWLIEKGRTWSDYSSHFF